MTIRQHIRTTKALLWISDLHLDQAGTAEKQRFLKKLTEARFDTAVITGDTSTADYLAGHLAEISAACGATRSVLFTTGNHEYFGSSFAEVDREIADTCRRLPNLIWLGQGQGELVQLNRYTALIGQRVLPDGRAGLGAKTRVRSPDHHLIGDFRNLTRDGYIAKLGALGDESANYFRKVLPLALKRFQTVYLACHVPPFSQALRHGGNHCRLDRQPFFCNRAVGNAIIGISRNFPRRRIIVFAGHSHSPWSVRMSHNLEIRVAGAQPGRPAFQQISVVD